MLILHNTLTGNKEEFTSIKPGHVKMYVCGVTPYADSHIGHGRCYVTFDLLDRLLKFLNYQVSYCRNFTDIDDKLLNKAQEQLGDKFKYKEIAEKYIASFHRDMQSLNCLAPTFEPRVTDNIAEIIEFIADLIEKKHAYSVDGDVYFDISSFPAYGILSKHKLDDLRAGARVDVREQKRDPLDFALWKGEKENTFWPSPWGWGRPGWHIECSALARKYLGDRIDIHGGGLDLVFPHHENEIAQSESLLGHRFANYWIHNGFVTVDKEKMSKSLGNVFSLREICEIYDPMVIRFYLLNHHYRAPLDFSKESIEAVGKTYQRLCKSFQPFIPQPFDKLRAGNTSKKTEGSFSTELVEVFGTNGWNNEDSSLRSPRSLEGEYFKSPFIKCMLDFLCDDMNTVGMFGVLFEDLREILADPVQAALVKCFMIDVLGLKMELLPEKQVEITPEIQKLLDEREEARKNKDWARSDVIRDQLVKMGVEIQDKKLK